MTLNEISLVFLVYDCTYTDPLVVITPQQGSRASFPPPRLPREASMSSSMSGSQQEPRDWPQDTGYVDFDSDDSLDEGSPGQLSSRHASSYSSRAFRKSSLKNFIASPLS